MAPTPVTINAIVPGSGAELAWALKPSPPGQQLLSTHAKPIAKLEPFSIPARRLWPLIPARRICTEPSSSVVTVQLRNRLCWQLTAAAGTPVSISFSEVQFLPDALVKNRVPVPCLGVVNSKFIPTFLQPVSGQRESGPAPPPFTPRIMILGSFIPSAKAKPVHSSARETSRQRRDILMGVFLFFLLLS